MNSLREAFWIPRNHEPAETPPRVHLERVVVVVTTWAALIFLIVVAGSGWATGSGEIVRRAGVPGTVFLVGGVMLLIGRPRVLTQLFAAIIALSLHAGLFEPFPNTELGLVAMGLTGVLFVRRLYAVYIIITGCAVVAAGVWWGDDLFAASSTGLVFAFSGSIFAWLKYQLESRQRDLEDLSERSHLMFAFAPVPIWDLDLTDMKAWLRTHPLEIPAEDPPSEVTVGAASAVLANVRVTAANAEASLLLGEGADSDPAATPLTSAVLVSLLADCRRGVAPGELSIEMDSPKDGKRCLRVRVALRGRVDEFGPDGILISATDVTDVVEAAEALESLVDSKDEFIASVSHEIRTPITAVVGLAQELHDRFDEFDRAEVTEFIEIVSEQSADVANIVEDLLVAARAEIGTLALQYEAVDLVALAQSGGVAVGEGRIVTSELDLVVRGDASRIRQIMRNLLVNADRYGGENVRVCLGRAGDDALVEVRDDGEAIGTDLRTRIFDAYQSGNPVPGRTGSVGLGLTVSRQLACLMDGDLTYDHDGVESVFSLRLPLAG